MSSEAMYWAMSQSVKDPALKLVLIAMSDYTEMDGWYRGGVRPLLAMTEMDAEAVAGHIATLERMGVVKLDGERVYLAGGDLMARRERTKG